MNERGNDLKIEITEHPMSTLLIDQLCFNLTQQNERCAHVISFFFSFLWTSRC